MKRMFSGIVAAGLMAAGSALLIAQGQGQDHAPIQIPDSSIEQPGDRGVAAHTNHLIRVDRNAIGTSPTGETPARVARVLAASLPDTTSIAVNRLTTSNTQTNSASSPKMPCVIRSESICAA